MHKKIAKGITGGLAAAAMLATSALAYMPMSADAGSCIGQTDFDNGVGLPWHTCVTNPATQEFKIEDGAYICKITNPGGADRGGDSRWDCQFRHRSLHIESGHTYTISFDVNSSADGELHTHIADLKGTSPVWLNAHQGEQAYGFSSTCPDGHTHTSNSGNLAIKKGDNHFEGTFTATSTLEVAEWAFHYGGAGEWQSNDCFPVDTVLKFDNMKLECTTCGDTYKDETSTPCLWDPTNELGVVTPRSDVRINQVGYFPNMVKKATYATDSKISPVDW